MICFLFFCNYFVSPFRSVWRKRCSGIAGSRKEREVVRARMRQATGDREMR